MRPYGEIAKHILFGVGIAGVVVVVAAAPGVVLAVKLFPQDKQRFPKHYKKHAVAQTVRRLEKNNLLTVRKKDGKSIFELTQEGKRVFQELQQKEKHLTKLQIKKPPQWDGKWRILTFDIPDNSHKQTRDVLRGKLKKWEFYPLQKSVWVCPWPCEKEIETAAKLYGISRFIKIIVAERISDDTSLRKHFNL